MLVNLNEVCRLQATPKQTTLLQRIKNTNAPPITQGSDDGGVFAVAAQCLINKLERFAFKVQILGASYSLKNLIC